MVQGSTNAVIQQGGKGGAGDVVYAVNQTGKDLVAGDKVWLNTTTTENVHSQNFRQLDNSVYSVGNKMFSSGKYRFDWGGEKFVTTTIGTLGLTDTNADKSTIQYRDGIRFLSGEGQKDRICVIRNDGTPLYLIKPSNVERFIKVLNRLYCIVYYNSRWFLRKYDYTTGKVEDTDIWHIKYYSWKRYCYYCLDNSKQAAYVDTTNSPMQLNIIDDIEKGSEANIIHSYQITESVFYPYFFTDGFNLGSYCLADNGTAFNYEKGIIKKPIIYKFYEDGFRLADDLPESLSKLMYVDGAYTCYNNYTKVLTISLSQRNEIHVYKLGEDGLFHELYFDIVFPNDKYNDGTGKNTRVTLSDDMSQLFLSYTNTANYQSIQAYKFNYIDGKWRATTSVECNANTLTGFATGNVNEVGESEVSTVLPDKVTLTFNVTPDPDTLELKGIVA